MGDGLKLYKDKRHRSSSSIGGAGLEGTRSERKLELKGTSASIPEVDDHFSIAESRCEDLQEKLDLVKDLKRKRKMKKRSMTRVAEPLPPPPENIPFISVRTQPKKKVKSKPAALLITEVSQRAARMHRMEPANPVRGYLDAATQEQRTMLGQINSYKKNFQQAPPVTKERQNTFMNQTILTKPRRHRARADGDSTAGSRNAEVACGEDDITGMFSDKDDQDSRRWEDPSSQMARKDKTPRSIRQQFKPTIINRRRHVPKEVTTKEEKAAVRTNSMTSNQRLHVSNGSINKQHTSATSQSFLDDRPVVELFNKKRLNQNTDAPRRSTSDSVKGIPEVNTREEEDDATANEIDKRQMRRRIKYRVRRYELPTVASQMKQAEMRFYSGSANHTNIPFVISKSCAPSHNIGVNIQQVLNGLKIQQPLTGIPLTIAHHMGLGHIPPYEKKNIQPSLDNREINAIQLGRRLLRLPSYKYMSYNKLLNMYREGDGLVSRFLRAISRPHYFYTSMYNLATREDFDGATSTSKGRNANQEAKQSLAEYASLYREFEQVDKRLKETHDPDLERRKEELANELVAREEYIRKVVQEYRNVNESEAPPLRASASTADDAYRYATFKASTVDAAQ